MTTKQILPFLALMGHALAAGAATESFDGSTPLLCATVQTVECSTQASCRSGTADSLRFPQFLQIDIQQNSITATRPDGTALNAAITNISRLDDRLVLQGVENSLGWSVTISRASGRMAVAIAGDQVTFGVFGACTVR